MPCAFTCVFVFACVCLSSLSFHLYLKTSFQFSPLYLPFLFFFLFFSSYLFPCEVKGLFIFMNYYFKSLSSTFLSCVNNSSLILYSLCPSLSYHLFVLSTDHEVIELKYSMSLLFPKTNKQMKIFQDKIVVLPHVTFCSYLSFNKITCSNIKIILHWHHRTRWGVILRPKQLSDVCKIISRWNQFQKYVFKLLK